MVRPLIAAAALTASLFAAALPAAAARYCVTVSFAVGGPSVEECVEVPPPAPGLAS